MSMYFGMMVRCAIHTVIMVNMECRDLDERSQLKLCKSASIVAPTTDECLSTSGDACELGDKNDYVYMVLKGAVKVCYCFFDTLVLYVFMAMWDVQIGFLSRKVHN